ncbi:hypothetical protein [Rhizobium sp. BK251]|uniref:hypothetical protein n=1 Tax=Rhizobium sp. BK251 TaxID=2512125 RepID=UPI001043171C|nr:hypothetical protein [Rhizobium sp. BK251]
MGFLELMEVYEALCLWRGKTGIDIESERGKAALSLALELCIEGVKREAVLKALCEADARYQESG